MSDILDFRNMIFGTYPIKPTSKNGFHIYLPNAYKVSVQWGMGTYSDNHDLLDFSNFDKEYLESNTAEIAVINSDGQLIETPFSIGDTVIGWQTPAQIMTIIEWARQSPHSNVCPWCGMLNDPKNLECAKCGGPLRKYKG